MAAPPLHVASLLPTPRVARAAVSGVFLVHGAVAGSFATRIPWIRDHLGLSPGALGLALLVPALGALLAMPLSGALVHRVDGRIATRRCSPGGAASWRCRRSRLRRPCCGWPCSSSARRAGWPTSR